MVCLTFCNYIRLVGRLNTGPCQLLRHHCVQDAPASNITSGCHSGYPLSASFMVNSSDAWRPTSALPNKVAESRSLFFRNARRGCQQFEMRDLVKVTRRGDREHANEKARNRQEQTGKAYWPRRGAIEKSGRLNTGIEPSRCFHRYVPMWPRILWPPTA